MLDRSTLLVLLVGALSACGSPDAAPAEDASEAPPVAINEAGLGDSAAAPAPELPGATASAGGRAMDPAGRSAAGGGSADEPGRPAEGGANGPASAGAGTPPSTGAPSSSPAPVGTDAAAILARAEEVYSGIRSMQADFVQRVYVPLLDDTLHSRGELYHRAPGRFLMRFSDPEGDIIVTDGQYAWMYYPSNDPRQVMRGRLSEGGQQVDLQREFLSNSTQRFAATRTGSARVDGRETHALTLRPRGASPYEQVRLWVDTESHLVRRFEITEQNESVRTIELSGIRTNVTLGDDLFRFTPPPGAQIIEP